jgi:hypothetical protein
LFYPEEKMISIGCECFRLNSLNHICGGDNHVKNF